MLWVETNFEKLFDSCRSLNHFPFTQRLMISWEAVDTPRISFVDRKKRPSSLSF